MRICKTALIVGNPALAEPISILFRKSGTYFGLFEAPESFTDMHGRFHNTIVKIANSIRMLRPKVIIIAGCSQRVKDEITSIIQDIELRFLDEFGEDLLCDCPGFLFEKKRMTIEIQSNESDISGDIVAVDPLDEITLTLAKNLSVAMGASVIILPEIDDAEIHDFKQFHYNWKISKDTMISQDNRNALFQNLKKRLGKLFSEAPKSITFITKGIPYGALPFSIPTSHLFNFPALLGVNIARSVAKTYLDGPRVPLAVLIAPDPEVSSEVSEVCEILKRNAGYMLRTALGKNAKAFRVSMLLEYLPSDLIIFSSHAGEVEGQTVVLEFEHPPGTVRRLVYDRVQTFNLIPNTDRVHLIEFQRYVSLDGIQWPTTEEKRPEELRKAFAYYLENMKDLKKCKIVSEKTGRKIKGSGVFAMADFNYVPVMHECGSYTAPIVIANACSTWGETADKFVAGGASVYIGTTLDISDAIAREILPKLIKSICKGQNFGYALMKAQKSLVQDLGYSPYLMEGFIFATLEPIKPFRQNHKRVQHELKRRILSFQDGLSDPREKPFLEKNKMALTFLDEELRSLLDSLKQTR